MQAGSQHEDAPQNLFMKLPPELRNRIYGVVLIKDTVIVNKFLVGSRDTFTYTNQHRGRNALLRTSKQIRSEALPLYFGCNTFKFHLSFSQWDVRFLANTFRNLMKVCGKQPFRKITFHLHNRNILTDLAHIKPLANLAFDEGLNLFPDETQEIVSDFLEHFDDPYDFFRSLLLPKDAEEYKKLNGKISVSQRLFHIRRWPTKADMALEIILRLATQARIMKNGRRDYDSIWAALGQLRINPLWFRFGCRNFVLA